MKSNTEKRFQFALSSFSRTYGVGKLTPDMIDFCRGWSEQTMPPPLEGLNEVDQYFMKLWNLRNFWDT